MKVLLFLSILVILSCTGKRIANEEMSLIPDMDTLLLYMYLNDPVDPDSLATIEDECILLGSYGYALITNRYQCHYILDTDTLATKTFTNY